MGEDGREPPRTRDAPPGPELAGLPGSRSRWIFFLFLAAAAYFLLTEHRAHVIQALPWIILAACPLMHVFMHRGHGARRSGPHGGGGEAGQ